MLKGMPDHEFIINIEKTIEKIYIEENFIESPLQNTFFYKN